MQRFSSAFGLLITVSGLLGCESAVVPADEAGRGEAGAEGSGDVLDEVEFASSGVSKEVSQLDLLLVIDNSLGMGQKQQIFANSVGEVLARVAEPDCVGDDGSRLAGPDCPEGMRLEHRPLTDVHIGVISSSLGDNGGNYCPEPTEDTPENIAQNDHAWLVGALSELRTGLAKSAPDFVALGEEAPELSAYVLGASEVGCGLEMPLEAMYRFLIDPAPPVAVDLRIAGDTTSNTIRSSVQDPTHGVDRTLLEERKAFLRPDSLVGILLLSDENDCSMKDSGIAFLPSTIVAMRRGTSTCETEPNSECCYSCYFDQDALRPMGCEPDPTCQDGGVLPTEEDFAGLRCFDQKRRFGVDFLMPVERYVNALTRPVLCLGRDDLACPETGVDTEFGLLPVKNPLFSSGGLRDNPAYVVLGGILGVPWQDVATRASLEEGAALELRRASALEWSLFAPTDGEYGTDPFMEESAVPRQGKHPLTGDALTDPDATTENAINGHEHESPGILQYACTFSLAEPLTETDESALRDCSVECAADGSDTLCERRLASCPCLRMDEPPTAKSPLCQDPATGDYGTTQMAAGATPSLRQLELLWRFSKRQGDHADNAVVGSICPKDLDIDARSTPGYGYTPTLSAFTRRLGELFTD